MDVDTNSKMFELKKIVFIGFGAVARTVLTMMTIKEQKFLNLPILIIEPLDISKSEIIGELFEMNKSSDEEHILFNKENNIQCKWLQYKLSRDNIEDVFEDEIGNNAYIIDLSIRCDTLDIVNQCDKYECLYINTSLDRWDNEYDEKDKNWGDDLKKETLYTLSKHVRNGKKGKMTCCVNHGMNPGLISHFVIKTLEYMALNNGQGNNEEWIKLIRDKKYNIIAEKLGLSLIQISERDTQVSKKVTTEKKYINTWSVVGLMDEAVDPVQITLGTFERLIPDVSVIDNESGQLILPIRGYQLRTISYEPKGGKLSGCCIPHAECYSLGEFLQTDKYRPSIYYSYLVPDNAKIMLHYLDFSTMEKYKILRSDEIKHGYDSVGCLCYFRNTKKKDKITNVVWNGTIISNDFAKKISHEINATCIQVAISILAAMNWSIQNPHMGYIEPEQVDSSFVMKYCKDYLGETYIQDVTEFIDDEYLSDQLYDLIVTPDVLYSNWADIRFD